MEWTREQYIEIIREYKPVMEMKTLTELIPWEQLPNKLLEQIAGLCMQESNDFDFKHA